MDYLIDGYNLLHVMGVLGGKLGPDGLGRARNQLLAKLHAAYGAGAVAVTVVFDAANPPRDRPAELEFKGVQVRFAVGRHQADDLIEDIIAQASTPKRLTVVSDDHRLQRAARRRRCVCLGCDAYLRWLDRAGERRPPPAAGEPAKPHNGSSRDKEDWLRTFGYLDDDPDFKEIFRRYDFGEDR
jgi:hypothetical protein